MKNYSTVIFLGNGYDVARGYRTKYSDFYQDDLFNDLCKKDKSDNQLAQFIQQVNNERGPENWCDLEEALFLYSCKLTEIKKKNSHLQT